MPYTGYMITWKSLIQAIRIIVKPGWLFLKGGRIAAKQVVFKDRRVKGESATPSKKKKIRWVCILSRQMFRLNDCKYWVTKEWIIINLSCISSTVETPFTHFYLSCLLVTTELSFISMNLCLVRLLLSDLYPIFKWSHMVMNFFSLTYLTYFT